MTLTAVLIWTAIAVFILVAALSIYPGELSWFGARANARLYDAGASQYESKWQRHDYAPYDAQIERAAGLLQGEKLRVLDLCTGTGRALAVAVASLDIRASYTAVDSSSAMLSICKQRVADLREDLSAEITLSLAEVSSWLAHAKPREYQLITLMEASEFIPDFPSVFTLLAKCLDHRGMLVMTYPTSIYALCFPRRAQARRQLHVLIHQSGLQIDLDTSWRSRYRICVVTKP